jgi:ParB family chromosome partitioning protein
MKRKALGKGLRSLIPEAPAKSAPRPADAPARTAGSGLVELDIDRIVPNLRQPRQSFDEQALDELARSLQRDGMLQPVIVRQSNGGYELIAGERRWRAAQRAGLLKITAIIREVADERVLELALVENLQREELNPLEEAHAYQMLLDELALTQQEVADRVGKQRATIANALRILNLPGEVQQLIRDRMLSAGHAKALAALANAESQIGLAKRIVNDGLSVRQVEALVARAAAQRSVRSVRRDVTRDPNILAAEESLQTAVGTKVRIHQARKGGRIEIHFYSDEEMERVYQLIMDATKPRTEAN